MPWFRNRKADERPEEAAGSDDATRSEAREAPRDTSEMAPAALEGVGRRMEDAELPPEALAAAREEYERLAKSDSRSPEFSLGLNYLEFILSLPWNVTTKDDLDLVRAEDVLNARHHGLDLVKERILEFLAVKNLRSRHRPRILLADDEAIARENLSFVFEKEGYEVTAVANGIEAVAEMERKAYDVVVTDLKMEGMDGLELLQEVRRRWPGVGAIMLTGYATVKTAVTAMQEGADQYLSKPVNLTKLRQYVIDILDKRQRARNLHGPVLCFTGPPGTGKTSIGAAIAEALGRKFVRMSLAGLRDEAELRGHRRTYVGAMPGRILQEVQKAGVRNPVIMLDEMDKIIQDFKGDATSVLLEILDPQQNSAYVDHYLGIPFDLSEAMFIATANLVERLPDPLRDRMEVIPFSSYTLDEKLAIATDFLIPAQLAKHGLPPESVQLPPETVRRLIIDYTREAGLRGLERVTASLCRKLARRALADGDAQELLNKPISLTDDDLAGLLGPPEFPRTRAQAEPRVGLATGLVWTVNGGEIIFVEAVRMQGSKQLTLTGSLGDILRESARTALSYIRSQAQKYDIPPDFFEASDIHVHIPAGGITKEGPSAGVTITIALLSMLTGRPVRQDMAVSGELSLLGEILPVGGIREKVMAAGQAGITTVILPEGSARKVAELTSEVTRDVEIKLVKTVDEAAELMLV